MEQLSIEQSQIKLTKAFKSFDTCMDNTICKIVFIVGIVVAALISLWIFISIARCFIIGPSVATCCCCCPCLDHTHERELQRQPEFVESYNTYPSPTVPVTSTNHYNPRPYSQRSYSDIYREYNDEPKNDFTEHVYDHGYDHGYYGYNTENRGFDNSYRGFDDYGGQSRYEMQSYPTHGAVAKPESAQFAPRVRFA